MIFKWFVENERKFNHLASARLLACRQQLAIRLSSLVHLEKWKEEK